MSIKFTQSHKALSIIAAITTYKLPFSSIGEKTVSALNAAGVSVECGKDDRCSLKGKVGGVSPSHAIPFLLGVYQTAESIEDTSVSGWAIPTIREDGKPVQLKAVLQSKGMVSRNIVAE